MNFYLLKRIIIQMPLVAQVDERLNIYSAARIFILWLWNWFEFES